MPDNGQTDWAKKCGARKRSTDGGFCKKPAGWGTTHKGYGLCFTHAGNRENHVKSAARKEAEQMFHAMGAPVEVDPQNALLEEVYRTAGHVRWLAGEISGWRAKSDDTDMADVTGQPMEIDLGEFSTQYPMSETQKKWHTIYMKERDHLAKVAKMAVDAGVAQRQVQLAEAQAERIVWVIEAMIKQLGLTEQQRNQVPEILPPLLREVTSERMDRSVAYGEDVVHVED